MQKYWELWLGKGGSKGFCFCGTPLLVQEALPRGMLCRGEAGDMLEENLIETNVLHNRGFCREVSGCQK